MNRYLDDDEATKAAFTNDGFFKTGDHAHRVGDDVVIDGRISTDCKYCRDPYQYPLPSPPFWTTAVTLHSCTIPRLQGPHS